MLITYLLLILLEPMLVSPHFGIILSITKCHSSGGGSPRFKDMNQLLRLLVESEISRLCVWRNPTNDARRGGDHVNFQQRSLTDVKSRYLLP
jgi:hypothetical protein